MCLFSRMFKSMIYSTCIGARTLYARFKCKPVNISVVFEYIPTKSRKSPSQAVVYKELRELLNKISRRSTIICMGDFNSRVCRNQRDLTDKWCIYKKVDSGGEILLQTMREFGLIYDLAVSTMVQPKCMWDLAYEMIWLLRGCFLMPFNFYPLFLLQTRTVKGKMYIVVKLCHYAFLQ